MSASNGGEDVKEDWLGAPMYWSNWDRETNVGMVGEAGLEVLSARVEESKEDDRLVPFLWGVARR